MPFRKKESNEDAAPETAPDEENTQQIIAEFNAEHAAEEARAAEEEAAKIAREAALLAEAVEDIDQPKARRCPRCRERMIKHDNPADPHKYGAWHCNSCGVCWRGNKLREGELVPAGFQDDN